MIEKQRNSVPELKLSVMWIKFALHFYNLFSFSSLRFENGRFRVSKIIAVSNLIKLPLCSFLSILPVYYKPLQEKLYDFAEETVRNYSTFAVVSMVLTFVSLTVAEFSFCCIQVANRHKVAHLANALVNCSMDDQSRLDFKIECRQHSLLLLFLYIAMNMSQYLSMAKMSLFSIMMSIIFSYPSIVLFAFVSAVNTFENFVIALLRKLREDLKTCVKPSLMRKVEFYKRYQEIFDLVEFFNGTFAHQFTIFSVCFFIMSVFNVSLHLTSNQHIFMSNFFLSQVFNGILYVMNSTGLGSKIVSFSVIILTSCMMGSLSQSGERFQEVVDCIISDQNGMSLVRTV